MLEWVRIADKGVRLQDHTMNCVILTELVPRMFQWKAVHRIPCHKWVCGRARVVLGLVGIVDKGVGLQDQTMVLVILRD